MQTANSQSFLIVTEANEAVVYRFTKNGKQVYFGSTGDFAQAQALVETHLANSARVQAEIDGSFCWID